MQKLFHKKGVPHHHKMHIPEDEEKKYLHLARLQYADSSLTWLWMILNRHSIPNHVTLVSANNFTAWWQ